MLVNGTAGQTTLGLLGSSSNGASSGTITIYYTDGTSSTGKFHSTTGPAVRATGTQRWRPCPTATAPAAPRRSTCTSTPPPSRSTRPRRPNSSSCPTSTAPIAAPPCTYSPSPSARNGRGTTQLTAVAVVPGGPPVPRRECARRPGQQARPGGIVVPETVSHFIGGKHVHSTLRKTYGVTDPATGKEYAQVEVGLGADINQAVLAARNALETGPWPGMPAAERATGPVRYRGRDRRTGRRHRRRRGARPRPAGHPGQRAGRTGGRHLPPRRRADLGADSGRCVRGARSLRLRAGAPGRHRRADHVVAHPVPGSGAGGRARPGRGLLDRAQAG